MKEFNTNRRQSHLRRKVATKILTAAHQRGVDLTEKERLKLIRDTGAATISRDVDGTAKTIIRSAIKELRQS